MKVICNYQHLHIIKNSPDHVFAKRTCTNGANDDITLAYNPEEEFDCRILPGILPDILPAAGLSETRLAYCEKGMVECTNVVEGKSYLFVHVHEGRIYSVAEHLTFTNSFTLIILCKICL